MSDLTGNAIGLEVAEMVSPPEQTIGTDVSARPNGEHAIVYTTSDIREIRVRRYGADGPLDPSPVTVSGDVVPDYLPRSVIFTGATVPAIVVTAFPYAPPDSDPDVRFALIPLTQGPLTPGPRLSQLVPGFAGAITDLAALAGPTPRFVVLWQEVELDDPETCGCSVPPPVLVEFFAQILELGPEITADGPPRLVYRWVAGDAPGPPLTGPRAIVASEVPDRFTVVWSDGFLRYLHVGPSAVGAEALAVSTASTLSARPNPFRTDTTLSYATEGAGNVRLTIVDVRGRKILRLVDSMIGRGTSAVTWNGRDESGERVAPGVYFARLESAGLTESVKLVLLE